MKDLGAPIDDYIFFGENTNASILTSRQGLDAIAVHWKTRIEITEDCPFSKSKYEQFHHVFVNMDDRMINAYNELYERHCAQPLAARC